MGTGRTFGEALQRAQQNARGRAMWEQVGRDMAEYVLEKEGLQHELGAVRQAYWDAADGGAVPRELEERYWNALWQRDFHYLGLAWADHIAVGIGGSEKEGMVTLIDNLSTMLSGGRGHLEPVHAYANHAFEGWIGHLKNLWPEHDFDFTATLVAGRESYAEYVARRNVAEYLFRNPHSPLGSENSGEFLLGWLLASNSSRNFDEAEQRIESMLRVVGRVGFDRAAEAARARRLVPSGIEPKGPYDPVRVVAHANQSHSLDWVATKHDPDLYAIYLIRRSTGGSWEWAEAIHHARKSRLGDAAEKAIDQAFAAAEDSSEPCVGEPNLQEDKASQLHDCVRAILGPQTLWADALEVALAEMETAPKGSGSSSFCGRRDPVHLRTATGDSLQ